MTARRQRIPTFEPCFNDRVTAFWHFGQLADEHPDNLQGNGTPTASGVAHYPENSRADFVNSRSDATELP